MGNREIRHMNIPILMYHEVFDRLSYTKNGNMLPSYFVSSKLFRAQLQLISNLNISTISLNGLTKIEGAGKIIISFDDGLIGNYFYAFPAIKEHGMVATFFCAVSLIGKKGMMTWSQLKDMARENMSIQSHGFSHKPLASLSKKEILDELKRSKVELEDRLGNKVSYLSLPHGSFNDYVINASKEIGYERICTSLIGYNKGDEYLLKRIFVNSEYDLNKYERIITAQYNFAFLKLTQKIKTLIKDTVGHQNYLALYDLLARYKR